MLLVSVRASEPGRHARHRAAYGFQPEPAHPRLTCGFAATTGHGTDGKRTVRTKGTRSFQSKFCQLFAMTAGMFTLATVAYWRPRAYRGGAAMVLRSALGAWFSAPAVASAAPLAYAQAVPPALGAAEALQPQPHW